MSELTIHMFPCLADNYGYLLHDAESDDDRRRRHARRGRDRGAARRPRAGGSPTSSTRTTMPITRAAISSSSGARAARSSGPRADAARIPGIDVAVGEGDVVALGAHRAAVFDTPGHTRGHIVYHFAAARAAFVGDTLFALGCGRLFEGTPAQMWSSLQKILSWPDDTRHLLRARVHAEQRALRADRRAAKSRVAGACGARWRSCAPRGRRRCRARSARSALRIHSCGRRAEICARRSISQRAPDVDVFAKTRALKDAF